MMHNIAFPNLAQCSVYLAALRQNLGPKANFLFRKYLLNKHFFLGSGASHEPRLCAKLFMFCLG